MANRNILQYYGSKAALSRKIMELLPTHVQYAELYFGTGALFFNKPMVSINYLNDIDPNLYNFFKILKTETNEFVNYVETIPYCQKSFDDHSEEDPFADDFDRAVSYYVRTQMSWGGLGKHFIGVPKFIAKFHKTLELIPEIAKRLQQSTFTNKDTVEVIKEIDSKKMLFYLDPPYYSPERRRTSVYRHEMSKQQHITLLETILQSKGTFFISGYSNHLYEEAFEDWKRYEFEVTVNYAGSTGECSKPISTEIIWTNY